MIYLFMFYDAIHSYDIDLINESHLQSNHTCNVEINAHKCIMFVLSL